MSDQTPSYTAHITPQTNLVPAINAWHLYLEDQGNSPHTIKAFTGDLQLLAAYLAPDRQIGTISTVDLNNFLQWLQKGRGVPCSPKSLARRITSLKAFFRWLHQYAVLLVDPAEKVIQRTVISPLPTILDREEVDKSLEAAAKHRRDQKPDARPYVLLSLLLETGIKKSECLGLCLNHIELDDGTEPFIFVRYPNPQYRYKERKIPVSSGWIEAYHEYVAQYQPEDQLFPWSPRRLEYLLEDTGEEAGLDKHLSFDMCRWTCAIMDWQAGIEHNKIRQKLGISKIQWREVRMKLEKLANGETEQES